jgi:hypothetical protein
VRAFPKSIELQEFERFPESRDANGIGKPSARIRHGMIFYSGVEGGNSDVRLDGLIGDFQIDHDREA